MRPSGCETFRAAKPHKIQLYDIPRSCRLKKQHGKELEYDNPKKEEFLVFIAPTEPKLYNAFSRNFVLNYYVPSVILPYVNKDVRVMRVAKEGLKIGAFICEIITK